MKKLSILLSFVIITIFITGAFIYANDGGKSKDKGFEFTGVTGQPRSTMLNINSIATWLRADGWSARDPRTGNAGTLFPRGVGTNAGVIFQDGIIWGGLVNDGQTPVLRVGGQTYNIGTVEGRIVSKGNAEDPNAQDVRIYRVRRDYATADLTLESDPAELGLSVDEIRAQYETDWKEWPWQKGAPWTGIGNALDGGYLGPDGETILGAGNGVLDRGEDANSNGILDDGEDANGNGKLDGEVPGIAGADQVVWTVANDLTVGAVQGLYGSPPIGLEMQLTAWGYDQTGALGSMIFKQVKLMYKGTKDTPTTATIDSMYICQWSDPDLGTYTDDFVGVDTTLSLAFVYNSSSVDGQFAGLGLPPPSSGYDFFQGVLLPGVAGEDRNKNGIDDAQETAISNLRETPVGFINLPMTSFGYFAAGSPIEDPGPLGSYEGTIEWWNLLRGFTPQSDPNNPVRFTTNDGQPTLFPLSGDPVTGTGDVDGVILPPGDRRLLMVTGPFTMAFGDTQEVVISLMAALGSDRLSSVAVLKFFDKTAQSTFDNLFQVPRPPAKPKVTATGLDQSIVLNWGFDEGAIATTEGQDELGYKFEGYNVYQLKTPSPDLSPDNAIKLATFDLVNEVTTILSETFDINSGVVIDRPVQVGTNSGLKRFFRVTKDAFRDRPIANDQDFFFAVTAYNFTDDPLQPNKSLESVPEVIRVRAQKPAPGVRFQASFGDSIEVTHSAGVSDGSVVVRVIDPSLVTGDDYKVVFEEIQVGDPPITEIVWHLLNVTKGDTVFKNQTKQITDPTDEAFFNADGLFIQVFGAPKDIKRASSGEPAIIQVAGPNGPLTPDNFDRDGSEFGGNKVWHSLNAGRADGKWWYMSAGGGDGGESRMFRGNNIGNAVPFDLEWRFGGESILWWIFDNGELANVPWTFWNVGIGTFDDPSDDKQLINISYSGGNTPGVLDFVNTENWFGGNLCSDWIYTYDGDYAAFAEDAADGSIDGDEPSGDEFTARMLICDAAVFGFEPGLAGSPPDAGTVIRFFTTKINLPADEFTFSTAEAARIVTSAQQKKEDALKMVGVFPNPYLGVNRLETSSSARFVRFNHLPEQATVRIFNLAGTLVRTMEKNDTSQYLDWNLRNENDLPVASGIYIANVEMPGLGSKNLKLIIIQEQQFLQTF